MTVRVDGSDNVPSFVTKTVTPDPIVLTSHVEPRSNEDTPYALHRDSDLKVTWTGGGKVGDVNVVVTEGPAPGEPLEPGKRVTSVQCNFKPTAHKGIIPAKALGFLGKGHAYIQVTSRNRRVVQRKGWTITVLNNAGAAVVVPSIIQ